MSSVAPEAPTRPDRPLRAGFAIAGLITVIYCAERFDAAARFVASLRANSNPTEVDPDQAWPSWLVPAWIVVAVVFLVLGIYVASRFLALVPRSSPCRKLVRALAYGAVVLWFLWLVSGIVSLAEAWERPRWVAHWLYWPSSALAAAALLLGGRDVVGGLEWRSAPLVRVHLLFLAALFVLVFRAPFTSPQLTDVLRGWGDGPRSRALAGVAAVLLLGAVIRASSRRLLLPRDDFGGSAIRAFAARGVPDRVPTWWRAARRLLARCPNAGRLLGGLIGALLVYAALKAPAFGPLLFAAVAAGVVALTTRKPAAPETPVVKSDEEKAPLHRLSGTLGTAPLAILVVGLVSATTDSLLLPDELAGTDIRLLAGTVVVIVLFGLLAGTAHLPLWSKKHRERELRWLPGTVAFLASAGFAVEPAVAAELLLALALVLAFRGMGARGKPELWAARGAFAGLALAVYLEPLEVPKAVGAFGIAMFGAAGITAALHALGHVAAHREMRWRLQGRVRSAPVLSLLVLWLLVAALNGPEDAHRARTVAATPGPPQTIEQAVRNWLDADRPDDGSPMLIVAASGGGSKAAYWTDLVLDCVFGAGVPVNESADECEGAAEAPQRRASLFLTSSVSGGSIGIHHLLGRFEDAGADVEWVAPTAGREVLSPLVAWGVFHDLPSFLLGLPADPRKCTDFPCLFNADRAVVLEAALAGGLDGKPPGDTNAPVPIFNATVGMLGWRRALLSSMALARVPGCTPAGGPVLGAFDGHDLLEGEDVPPITAAVLSARFPALLPPARFGSSETGSGCSAPTHPDVRIRDGGLIENTGVMTIVDLLPSIRAELEARAGTKVRLIVVSIDDDVPRMGLDNEYERGFVGSLGLDSSRDNSSRARETLLEQCRAGDLEYLRISPAPHVGAQAATGWEISETSRRKDLVKSLRSGEAAEKVKRLQGMLDGTVPPRPCDPDQPPPGR